MSLWSLFVRVAGRICRRSSWERLGSQRGRRFRCNDLNYQRFEVTGGRRQ